MFRSLVKGVGQKAVEQIIAGRKRVGRFWSLFQFCENVDLSVANKPVLESLIKAGAFDTLDPNRARMVTGMKKAMSNGSVMAADRRRGQLNLFRRIKNGDYSEDHQHLPDVLPWSRDQMSAYEEEVLGFHLTADPVASDSSKINCRDEGTKTETKPFQRTFRNAPTTMKKNRV